ncbi:MAG: hypothetical protein NVSMB39_2720 [Candidatus Saccharimonadales bacterium]
MDHEHTDMSEPETFHSAVDVDELLQAAEAPASTSVEALSEPGLINRINELPKEIQQQIREGQRVTDIGRSKYQAPDELPLPEVIVAELTHGHTGAADASRANGGEVNVANLDQGKFAALFGRDSIEIAKLLTELFPDLPRDTVMQLAQYQSTKDEPMADQEIGKIPHEVRRPGDKIAEELTAKRGWKFPYYGAVDATPNYISMLAREAKKDRYLLDEAVVQKIEKNGKEGTQEVTMRQSLDSALQWLINNQEGGQYGLIEYRRQNPQGIENQILRDSADSMSDKSGRLANHDQPIASLQAQANAYDAFKNAAALFRSEAESTNNAELIDRADDFDRRAQHLHDQVIERFWVEDERGGFFAVGLDYDGDGQYHQLDTRTNDMAYLLSSQMLIGEEDKEKVAKMVATLQSDEMKVGPGGLRSLSNQEVNFVSAAYHNGSDWLVADIEYAEGLKQHGYIEEAINTYKWIVEACESTKAYPEYVMGGDAPNPEINTLKVEVSTSTTSNKEDLNMLMQPPEMGQGWSVAAYMLAKKRLQELQGIPETEEALDEGSLVA